MVDNLFQTLQKRILYACEGPDPRVLAELLLLPKILRWCENTKCNLEKKKIFFNAFQLFFLTYPTVVKSNIQALKSVRSYHDFDLFWKYIERDCQKSMSIWMLEYFKIIPSRSCVSCAKMETDSLPIAYIATAFISLGLGNSSRMNIFGHKNDFFQLNLINPKKKWGRGFRP